jgi:hypothetical protein
LPGRKPRQFGGLPKENVNANGRNAAEEVEEYSKKERKG